MATYEVEHNIPPPKSPSSSRPRHPDFSTFFAALAYVDLSATTNPNALPLPQDVAAANRGAAEAYATMMDESEGRANEGLLRELVEGLMSLARDPPKRVGGVGDGFLDELERVPKKELKPGDLCPICGLAFLDDPYPLVIRLPCHESHLYDLECISPWLKLQSTCPLDRVDLLARREERRKAVTELGKEDGGGGGEGEEEEGEWDEMFA